MVTVCWFCDIDESKESDRAYGSVSDVSINVLADQRSAFPTETERVGKGEWGDDESGVSVKGNMLKERLKMWEKGDRLLWNHPLSRQGLRRLTVLPPHGMECGHQQVVSLVLQGVASPVCCQECSPAQFCKNL
jgi:hypothetical protein